MLKIASLVSLFFLAVALGVSFSHLLQAGPKATLSAEDFLMVQQVLISRYGIGVGLVESLAVLSLGVAAFLAREMRPRFLLTLAALGCVLAMIAIWAIWINPINQTVNSWSASTVPADWPTTRDLWHRLHALRLLLAAVALGVFTWGTLVAEGSAG